MSAIFEAALLNAQPDDVSRTLLESSVLDYLSRYMGDPTNPDKDEHIPNMSSSGVIP